MRDQDPSPTGAAFAVLLKTSRKEKGLTQEDVISATGVSRSTYLRWEGGDIERPDLRQVRTVCLFLDVNPRLAAVALGLVTLEELELPAPEPPVSVPVVVELGRILADPRLPEAAREALQDSVTASLTLWRTAMAMPEPIEPRGDDLVRRSRKANR